MATTFQTKSAISPRQIAEAKEKALRLAQVAFAPQPVKQADGSTVPLCWAGRLHRALTAGNAAQQAGDAAKVALIEQAIDRLSTEMHSAESAAADAEAAYMALCAAAGVTAEALPSTECTCVGCVEQRRLHALASTSADVRAAVWALLTGPVGELPAIVTLVAQAHDAGVRDRLWAHLKRISDALSAYGQACAENGEQPQWGEVWRC